MEPIEWGEDPQTGLLPNLGWLRTMGPLTRAHLAELVADWEGPTVDAWRADVAALAEDDE
ncbi:MAG TPA: hypothetical protein VGH66_18615 [Acidimicrobiales bacterium]|jgi:hypothetical protein